MKQYLPNSMVDLRLEVRPSLVQGRGIFATAPLYKGETVIIFGGRLFNAAELQTGIPAYQSCIAVSQGVYLGHSVAEGESPDDFLNHSCQPNTGLIDEVTLVALRDIQENEELTVDYATFLGEDENWPESLCNCGSPGCRGWITDHDWRLPSVQEKYRGYFSPFIEEKIRSLHP